MPFQSKSFSLASKACHQLVATKTEKRSWHPLLPYSMRHYDVDFRRVLISHCAFGHEMSKLEGLAELDEKLSDDIYVYNSLYFLLTSTQVVKHLLGREAPSDREFWQI